MTDLKIGQWGTGDPTFHDSLAAIKGMIDMDVEAVDVGWSEEPARLFSIDTAMLVLRRHAASLDELERQALSHRLSETRRLAVSEQEGELDFIQSELESYLAHTWDQTARCVWLTAMNATLPSPYRAAEAVVATALDMEEAGNLREVLRERLRARLGEGSLMTEQASGLFASAG